MSERTESETDEKSAGYHVGAPWDGHKRWVCDDELWCGFDAQSEERMRAHVVQCHGVQESQKVLVDTGLVDEHGKPLIVERETED